MIKRYGLGANPDAITPNSMRPSLVQIVEREDGDYVRYEDYMRIIDAIGAGGVKGQLMRKELSDEAAEEIKEMADIRIVDGRAELSNVRVIAHAITRRCNE